MRPSRAAAVKDGPAWGPPEGLVLGVPGMDPGLEVQVLCGASWKQPQAEGNCTQVGASRDNPACVAPHLADQHNQFCFPNGSLTYSQAPHLLQRVLSASAVA